MHLLRRVVALIALAICAIGFAPGPQSPRASRARVYCLTAPNPSGFVDQKLRDRQDSLKDVKDAIVKKKDWLQVVDSPDEADIVLEIVDRSIVPSGRTTATTTSTVGKDGKTVQTNTQATPTNDYLLTTVMRVGAYENELVGTVSSQYLGGIWRAAAGQVASDLEKWVKDNHERLMARRSAPEVASPAPPASTPAAAPAAGPPPPPAEVGDMVAGLEAERMRTNAIIARGALRKLALTETVYASLNQGLFGPIECLQAPDSCLTSYGSTDPLLSPSDLKVRGYAGTFYAGTAPTAAESQRIGAAKGSLESWAYYLDPTPASLSAPMLCVDSTGRICRFTGPSAGAARGASCPTSWEDVK